MHCKTQCQGCNSTFEICVGPEECKSKSFSRLLNPLKDPLAMKSCYVHFELEPLCTKKSFFETIYRKFCFAGVFAWMSAEISEMDKY
jgi:hypothetical protein